MINIDQPECPQCCNASEKWLPQEVCSPCKPFPRSVLYHDLRQDGRDVWNCRERPQEADQDEQEAVGFQKHGSEEDGDGQGGRQGGREGFGDGQAEQDLGQAEQEVL